MDLTTLGTRPAPDTSRKLGLTSAVAPPGCGAGRWRLVS